MLTYGAEVRIARQRADQQVELLPQVAVAAAFDLRGQLAQARSAVVGSE
jgi:hypothetical protein